MSWVAVAVGVGGALIGSAASRSAASAQADASDRAAAAQERMFEKQTELQEPFRAGGVAATNRLRHLLGIGRDQTASLAGMSYEDMYQMADIDHREKYGVGINEIDPTVANAWKDQMRAATSGAPSGGQQNTSQFGSLMRDFSMSDFEQDPGYAFRLSEGQKAIDRSAAARGGLQSGSALKAAARYGQDMGSQEYQNAFNRYQINRANKLQPLQSMAGMGQTSANTLTGAAGNLGQGLASAYTDAGNAQASGYMGQANAISGGLGTYLNYQQGQNYLNALKR